MKSAFLLTAMLSGLCAEVMASPISNLNYESRTAPVIERDLHFNAESTDEPFPDLFPDQTWQELVTTDFDQTIDEDRFAADESESSAPFGVPEPPPSVLMLVGLSSIGIFALGRRARWKRRHLRRRAVVRMRQIMAER
jgi:hypothetical protein